MNTYRFCCDSRARHKAPNTLVICQETGEVTYSALEPYENNRLYSWESDFIKADSIQEAQEIYNNLRCM